MVSGFQLAHMDNPTSFVEHRLLSDHSLMYPTPRAPLRNPQHDFTRFNSNSGHEVVRGRDDHQFDNPRVYGMYFTC